MGDKLEKAADVWSLHDFLSKRRKDIDRKYDYRYSQLLNIFTILISQEYISESDLLGLSEDKLTIIQRFLD